MAKPITITHRDGSTTPLASRSRATSITSAKQKTSLLSEDVVNISITATAPLPLSIGDKAEFYGRKYTLNRLPQPTKEGERRYTYELTFEGAQYDLLDVHYHLPQNAYGETYYADLAGHLEVLRWNINRIFPNQWDITSDIPTSDYKNITATEKNCLAVLQELCTAFEVEFVIGFAEGKNTLRITKATGKTFDRVLRYGRGRGLYSLQRTNVNNANITNRLYAYGGSDNLPDDYIRTEPLGGRGCAKLCLPGTTRTTSFVEDAASISSYGVKEGEKNYPDIKPQRVGEVTATGDDVVTFFDTSTDKLGFGMFDLNAKKPDGTTTKYLIDGTTAKITFQTGQLAGYEFDLHSYDHASNKFVINKFKDENGLELPNTEQGAFQIAAGDKYIITDIILPDEYIEAAERQLSERAAADLLPLTQPQVSYRLALDEAFFVKLYGTEADTVIFSAGDFIHIQDREIGVDKEVRITQIERDLLRPHTYEITLSDTVTKSTTVKVLNELSNLGEAVAINTGFADPAKARRRWMASQEVLSMVFDPEGDYYSEKIKPLSIETQMLSVGAKSTQLTLRDTTFYPNYEGNPNTLLVTSGVLVHYGIDPSGIRNWHFGQVQTSGLDDNTAYYIYAICDRNTANAQIVLSTQPVPCERDAGTYHFLVGVLNSVMTDTDGSRPARLVSLTYGSTTVNGRFIKTGRILSADGGTYFDLDNGEIGGRIVFTRNNETKTLQQLAQETQTHDNTKTAIDGGIITSGTVQLVNSASETVCAGITGGESDDTAHDMVRIWAGASKDNRQSAPFRVLQDGSFVASKGEITGNVYALTGRIGNLAIHGNYLVGLDSNGVERMRLGLGNIPSVEEAFERRGIAIRLSSDTAECSSLQSGYAAEARRRGTISVDGTGETNTANFSAKVSFTLTANTRKVILSDFKATCYTQTWDVIGSTPAASGHCILYQVATSERTAMHNFDISEQSGDVVFENLQQGSYEIDVSIRIYTGGDNWAGSAIFSIGGVWMDLESVTNSGVTMLAQDGILSLKSSSRFLYFSFDNGFEARYDGAGIKLSPDGLQKLVNGEWRQL